MADGDEQKQSNQLNFNLQEFLGDTSASDASFQSMVQNMNAGDGSYDRGLPAELQQLLGSSNGTDDLDLLWNKGNKPAGEGTSNNGGTVSAAAATTPQQQQATTPHTPHAIPSSAAAAVSSSMPWMMGSSASMSLPPNAHAMSMAAQQPTPSPVTSSSSPSAAAAAATPGGPIPSQAGAANSTTLLENITSQLPPDRKDQFIELFRKLQSTAISPEQFLGQARSLLGQQQYKQLEDLKNKPTPAAQDKGNSSDKRPISSTQGIITPQMKRPKTEHIPAGMPMGPPMAAAAAGGGVFKTPAGLQIPRAAVPSSMMRPPTSTPTSGTAGGAAGAGGSSSSGGGGGSDRIDYDTLTDVMGYAGVDLREEAEHFLSKEGGEGGAGAGGMLPDGVDRSRMQDFMNSEMLRARVLQLARPLQIGDVDADFVSYLALATQERLRGLVEQMVDASRHRVLSQAASAPPPLDDRTGHPLYRIVVQQDSRKQLLAIERAEREEERKRKELLAERERRLQMGDGDGEDGRSKKKKKDKDGTGLGGGPGASGGRAAGAGASGGGGLGDGSGKGGSTSETALIRAIGGVRKSWMLTGSSKDSPAQRAAANTAAATAAAAAAGGASAGGGPDTDDASPRGRGRPRGRKSGDASMKRAAAGRGRGAGARDLRHDSLGLFLPPSTIGRTHRLGDPSMRKVTVRDAIFALEKDCQTTGRAGGKRTLLKTYNQWLK